MATTIKLTDIPTTPVERWNANIDAIRILRELERENRPATESEQQTLALYAGFGDSAFNDAFKTYSEADQRWMNDDRRRWMHRGNELRELVSDEEYDTIFDSRINAFYTNPDIVRSMWRGLGEIGAGQLDRPVVLEPSAGSGRFLGLQPESLAERSRRIAVEKDQMTGKILRAAYPDTEVHITGFEEAPIADNSVDIAVSNVPFGNVPVFDPEYQDTGRGHLTRAIHNYFFSKSLDKLKPGGVLAYVTSHHSMDALNSAYRADWADRADLLGAVRLPNGAFPDTNVLTDIIYLRKRKPGEQPLNMDWVETVEIRDLPFDWSAGNLTKKAGDDRQNINRYFNENLDQVLGRFVVGRSLHSDSDLKVQGDHCLLYTSPSPRDS